MSHAVLKDENDRIVQIQKNGEIVWDDEEYVNALKSENPPHRCSEMQKPFKILSNIWPESTKLI